MALPPNCSYFMSRMQGVSCSHTKVMPQSSPDAVANQIVRFELPSNTLINWRSLRLVANVGIDETGVTATTAPFGRLPDGLYKCIERVAIYIGGTLVSNNFQHYNLLAHAKEIFHGKKADSVLGHPEIVRAKSYVSGANLASSSEIYERGTAGYCQFSIDSWEGLIGSIEPTIFDTGLVGSITIELTMADNVVCPTVQATPIEGSDGNDFSTVPATQAKYKFSDMSMQLEVLSMATPVLDEVVAERIEQIGHVSLPFKNYFTTVSNHTDSSRFNVNSASWDRVWVCYRSTNFATIAPPRRVKGHKRKQPTSIAIANSLTKGTFPAYGAGIQADRTSAGNPAIANGDTDSLIAEVDLRIAAVFTRGNLALDNTEVNGNFVEDLYTGDGYFDQARERYISNHFACSEAPTVTTAPVYYHMNVNGATLPQYHATRDEMYEITKNSIECPAAKTMTLTQYKDDFFVQCMRFCLPESDYSRQASGLDTRSTAAQASLNTSNLRTTNVVIYSECTSELRIGSGRSCAVMV